MTEGGDQGRQPGGHGDQYGDQYGERHQGGSFPPAPAPPWADQGNQPPRSQPYGQPAAPGYAQEPYGQPAAPGHGQQEPYGQPAAPGFEQQQPYWQQQPHGDQQYGQQQVYGQAPPYQPQPYGQQPWGTPPPGYGTPAVDYASWGARAGALLLDLLFTLLLYLPGIIVVAVAAGTADTGEDVNGGLAALGIVLLLAALVVQLWNQGWRQGAQGWSWGKQIVGIKLVRATDARPPGGGLGIGRLLLRNVLGNITFGVYTLLTYLWPLWDDRKQSLDDKILGTLVVRPR